MCGDLDNAEDTATLAAYRRLAAALPKDAAVSRTRPASDVAGYMSGLFNDIIARACTDAETAPSLDNSLLMAQSVVFARAAGVLAAQMNVREDPLRLVIEALMDGYTSSQGARVDADLDHHDHHDHHHHHGHHDHVHR
jgi:hypothetical protein